MPRRGPAPKDECRRGHKMTPENSYWYTTKGKRGRECRTCRNERKAAWRSANLERDQERDREYHYHEHEKRLQKVRDWKVAHPDRVYIHNSTRRMRVLGAESEDYGGLSAIFTRDGGRCTYCGEEVMMGVPNSNLKQATIDHVLPLSRGGTDLEENVVLACRWCNLKKKDGVLADA